MTIQIKKSGTAKRALRSRTGAFGGETYRCASYQRGQECTSINDQLRNRSDLAAQKEWTFLPQFAFSDQGKSGETLASRGS